MKQKAKPGKKTSKYSALKSSLASFAVMGRLLIVIGVLTAVLGMISGQAHAGFLGHNGLGDFGLQSGTQPDPGLNLALMYLRYDSDTLRNRDGDSISLDPNDPSSIILNADDPDSISVNGYAVGSWNVTNFKIFGANYGFMIFPGFTSNKLEAPILGLVQETDFGLTDLYRIRARPTAKTIAIAKPICFLVMSVLQLVVLKRCRLDV